MNPPKFDVTRLPLDVGIGYMKAVIAEEERVCNPIDERIRALESDYHTLVDEAQALGEKLSSTKGFFARWSIRTRLHTLAKRIGDNRSLRDTLTTARYNRTYGS